MDRIGEYLVRRLIGEGGMGKVYEAEERLSKRRVALKVLRPELTRHEDGRRLFLNEMQILAHLEHPNLVRSLASMETDGQLVLVLEYTIGFTLKPEDEAAGLDLSQHGETGVDVGPDVDGAAVVTTLMPRAATAPPPQTNGDTKRFSVVVDGVPAKELHAAWAALCQVGETPPPPEFTALYKYVTTVSGNKFRFRGGDPTKVRMAMQKLLEKALPDTPVETHVEH